ncbi:hypothetical protein A3Q56_08156, partial [Intoshia linei]
EPVVGFFGIQYASLIDGELNFMPGTSIYTQWDSIKMVTSFGPVCIQINSTKLRCNDSIQSLIFQNYHKITRPYLNLQKFDCLYLNVYIPYSTFSNITLPVLFIIDETNFNVGSGNYIKPEIFSDRNQVIVITVNYRLGIFGFLELRKSSSNINFAAYNILGSLHWIHNNIASFNGDVDNIWLINPRYDNEFSKYNKEISLLVKEYISSRLNTSKCLENTSIMNCLKKISLKDS